VIKHKKSLDLLYKDKFQVIVRSAINTDIQNTNLDHEEVIGQADNSLRDLFKMTPRSFNAFEIMLVLKVQVEVSVQALFFTILMKTCIMALESHQKFDGVRANHYSCCFKYGICR
jgi:5-formyltetrahydrofolate cyclo-ligase